MLKFYPDHVPARIPRLLGDMLTTFWVVVWAAAGIAVYRVVEGLQSVADGLTSTGQTFDSWIASFKGAVPRGIPGISSFLTGVGDALQKNTGDPLITFGAQAHGTIDNMALAFGLVTALPPILIVGGAYAAWRWRDAREMGAALAFVKAAERSGRLEQARALLAYRAVAQLNFAQLMRSSSDPVGDLSAHRYDALAAAMLKRAGLNSFRLYDPGAPKLTGSPHEMRAFRRDPESSEDEISKPAPPSPPQIGEGSQQEHEHGRGSGHEVGSLRPRHQRR